MLKRKRHSTKNRALNKKPEMENDSKITLPSRGERGRVYLNIELRI